MLVLFILISIGFLCGKKGIINDNAAKKMTDIVLYVVTPCVMISAFQKEFSADTLISGLGLPFGGFIFLGLLCGLYRKLRSVSGRGGETGGDGNVSGN